MNIAQAIDGLIEERGWNRARLAASLEISYPSLFDRLNPKKKMRVDTAIGMLNKLGYDLVAVPQGTRLPTGSVVVTDDDGEATGRKAGRPRKPEVSRDESGVTATTGPTSATAGATE